VRQVSKKSLAGFYYYCTARVVFFTHGLYGAPFPPRNKVFVNLWHGDGPKRAAARGELPVGATLAVTGSRRFGAMRTAAWGIGRAQLIASGNPRSDQLFAPASGDTLSRLGIGDRFILWLPTWRDGDQSPPPLSWPNDNAPQLVTKPHPFASMDDHLDGWTVISDADLESAGASLYHLLGAAEALITDYSSVWTEFLLLDRPIGFWMPDLERYRSDRGFAPSNWLDHLPGPVISAISPELFHEKFRATRHAARVHWQLCEADGASTDRLLDELARRGVLPAVRSSRTS
jgi:CDP-glycerol glycerophosphotransferase (TagB/SpsB family)